MRDQFCMSNLVPRLNQRCACTPLRWLGHPIRKCTMSKTQPALGPNFAGKSGMHATSELGDA